MKQPRVPEYREADGVQRYLKTLSLYLKDFSLDAWNSVRNLQKQIEAREGEGERDDDGMYAFHIDENGHLILTYDSTYPPPLSIDDRGHLVYTISSGNVVDLGKVVGGGSGGSAFDIGKTLVLKDGVLDVNTADVVEEDNTLPVTSAAVYETVGNINALLETI